MDIRKIILTELYNNHQFQQYAEAFKWKPSASQRREFAQRMQNPDERAAYEKRKEDRSAAKRANSKFNYSTAGGKYIPTQSQYEFVMTHPDVFKTPEEQDAANQIIYGYTSNEKIHHDYIHIVNEKIRGKS